MDNKSIIPDNNLNNNENIDDLIIEDVIQPIHIKGKPELKEGIKEAIV